MKHPLSALASLVLLAGSAHSQTLTYNVCLDGGQEAPPVVTTGSGSATVTLDTSSGVITVAGSYQNLLGTQTSGHLHKGAIGVGGMIQVVLAGTGGTTGTFSGTATLSAGQVSDVTSGLFYVNIHTSLFGFGEVRGQIAQAFYRDPQVIRLLSGQGGEPHS